MQKLGIIGAGLIGASIGRFYRKKYQVLCIGRNTKKLLFAKKLGCCDEFSIDLKRVSECDLVVIATPVDTIVPIAKRVLPHMKKNAILIDVGSVKGEICKKITPFAGKYGVNFVGCHPMAGSERSGAKFSRKDLFKGTTTIITPEKKTKKDVILKVKNFWKKLGARCVFENPQKHDMILAFTSHLPHLISYSYSQAFLKKFGKDRNVRNFTAGSFTDMTRVAKSSPDVWSAIFKMNKNNLDKVLSDFQKQIEKISKEKSPELKNTLKKIKNEIEKF